ncbi:unnamed protein product [Adineta ricciae]|uniref:Uncharacterized protein n=1 Tax=Adineta ricciae TaxID=249248 RepID=A0A814CMK4_ADIRI|nr:unnamed protein product [Adineta ricciae]CAF1277484.1 unnamed protein product [Adineta ricciae]
MIAELSIPISVWMSSTSTKVIPHMANLLHRIKSTSSDLNFKLSCEAIQSKHTPPSKSHIDFIRIHNNPEQPEIVLPNGERYCWYFAIGSMINPISQYLREITPVLSYPATCQHHKLVFRCFNGIADFEACPGSNFDGVAHLIPYDQMIRLDEIECFYHRVVIICTDYENQSQMAYAYQIKVKNQPSGIPRERYLDVIIKGCEYYKVRPEYTNHLRNEQPVVPRKQPHEFHSFQGFPPDVYYSEEELKKHDGSDPSVPLWISINGKILEYAGLPPPDHADHDFQKSFLTFLKPNLGGREVTNVIAKTLYEPLYKLPLTNEDICDEHRAQIEDFYYNTLSNSDHHTYWKAIGRLC